MCLLNYSVVGFNCAQSLQVDYFSNKLSFYQWKTISSRSYCIPILSISVLIIYILAVRRFKFFKRGFVALGRKDEKRNDIKSDKRTVNAGRTPWLFLRYVRK